MKSSQAYLLIVLIGALLYIPFLGHVHLFDWDEINFAECAREMIVTGNYWQVQIDFEPFWEKPPFFIWLQVLSMKLFGMNEVGARFPNAIIGISTLLVIFYMGKRFRNKRFAAIWTAMYAISILPHLYFKSGIIDPAFNLLIFISLFFFNSSLHRRRKSFYALLSGLSLGLAFITKGPVAILLFGLSVLIYFITIKAWKKWNWKHIGIIIISCIAVSLLWILPNYFMGGSQVFVDFIVYQIRLLNTQDAGHGGPFYYHFIILLIGCFPLSLFILQKNKQKCSINSSERDFHALMIILLCVTLFIFSIVKTKIVHYSSLCYFPMAYLAAHSFYNLWQKHNKANKYFKYGFLSIGTLLGLAVTAAPFIMQRKNEWIHLINDKFAQANLKADISWHWSHAIPGVILIAGTIAAFHLFTHRKHLRAFLITSIATVIFIQMTLFIYPKKIEAISQNAAINFSINNQNSRIDPLGYKSYAHLFYGLRKESYLNNNQYFISKKPHWETYANKGQFIEIEEKNGYVLLKKINE